MQEIKGGRRAPWFKVCSVSYRLKLKVTSNISSLITLIILNRKYFGFMRPKLRIGIKLGNTPLLQRILTVIKLASEFL